jgi:hypothetical protein
LIAQTRFEENLRPTAILDWEAPPIRILAANLRQKCANDRDLVRSAHGHLAQSVRPIYTLEELQPAPVTLQKQCGSCSQRMACLEAIARAAGVPTRARALRVSGQFWYPRFRAVGMFLPKEVMLIWPQFLLESEWTDLSEIYTSCRASQGNAASIPERRRVDFRRCQEDADRFRGQNVQGWLSSVAIRSFKIRSGR